MRMQSQVWASLGILVGAQSVMYETAACADITAAALTTPVSSKAAAPASATASQGVPVLAKGEGMILTPEPGERVPLTKGDKVVCQLSDGQRVKFIEELGGVGAGDSMATIEACGTRGGRSQRTRAGGGAAESRPQSLHGDILCDRQLRRWVPRRAVAYRPGRAAPVAQR